MDRKTTGENMTDQPKNLPNESIYMRQSKIKSLADRIGEYILINPKVNGGVHHDRIRNCVNDLNLEGCAQYLYVNCQMTYDMVTDFFENHLFPTIDTLAGNIQTILVRKEMTEIKQLIASHILKALFLDPNVSGSKEQQLAALKETYLQASKVLNDKLSDLTVYHYTELNELTWNTFQNAKGNLVEVNGKVDGIIRTVLVGKINSILSENEVEVAGRYFDIIHQNAKKFANSFETAIHLAYFSRRIIDQVAYEPLPAYGTTLLIYTNKLNEFTITIEKLLEMSNFYQLEVGGSSKSNFLYLFQQLVIVNYEIKPFEALVHNQVALKKTQKLWEESARQAAETERQNLADAAAAKSKKETEIAELGRLTPKVVLGNWGLFCFSGDHKAVNPKKSPLHYVNPESEDARKFYELYKRKTKSAGFFESISCLSSRPVPPRREPETMRFTSTTEV